MEDYWSLLGWVKVAAVALVGTGSRNTRLVHLAPWLATWRGRVLMAPATKIPKALLESLWHRSGRSCESAGGQCIDKVVYNHRVGARRVLRRPLVAHVEGRASARASVSRG